MRLCRAKPLVPISLDLCPPQHPIQAPLFLPTFTFCQYTSKTTPHLPHQPSLTVAFQPPITAKTTFYDIEDSILHRQHYATESADASGIAWELHLETGRGFAKGPTTNITTLVELGLHTKTFSGHDSIVESSWASLSVFISSPYLLCRLRSL